MYDTGAAQAVRLVWFGCIMCDGYSGVGTAKKQTNSLGKGVLYTSAFRGQCFSYQKFDCPPAQSIT